MNRMRFVVTGVAGFIGSHLAERLLADGHTVVGIDSFSPYYEPEWKWRNIGDAIRSDRFTLTEADLLAVDLHDLLGGADGVFHLAAHPGVRLSWNELDTYLKNNVLATQRLMEAIRPRPVPVVYASSSSVYGAVERLPLREEDPLHPISPYGVTKLAGENMVWLYGRVHDIPVAAVRFFTVYGPRQRPDMAITRFLAAALAGDPIEVFGDGEQSRDFTFVSDAVDAAVAAMGRPDGRAYNVGGGSKATVNEVITAISAVSGLDLVIRRLPQAAGDMRHTWADTHRAREDLGWHPHVSLRDGLAAQYAWALEALPNARPARAGRHTMSELSTRRGEKT
jgi:UDP-glucuronate 4-epimerase